MPAIRPVRIGTWFAVLALVAAGSIAGCQSVALPPPPSSRVVTLAPRSAPVWTVPRSSNDLSSFPIEVVQGVSASFTLPPPPVTRTPTPTHVRITPVPAPPPAAIQPTGPAPSGSGGYIGGRVWNDANRNGAPDAGETGLANVRVEIAGCSATTTVVYTDSLGSFGEPNLAAGTCRLRVVLSGFVYETTQPALGSPTPYPVLVATAAGRASYVNVAMVP